MADPNHLPARPDFRAEAAEASRLALAALAKGPVEAGISLCVETGEGGQAMLRRLRRQVLVRTVLGIGLLLGGCIAILVHEYGDADTDVAIVGMVAGVLGFLTLIAGPFVQKRVVRRWLSQRADAHVPDEADPKPVHVEIENSATFHKLKAIPEDLARVSFDREARRLVVEGILYRYIIYADDVESMSTAPSPSLPGLQIVYRAAGVSLGLTLTSDSLLSHLRRNTIGGRDALMRRAHETLASGAA